MIEQTRGERNNNPGNIRLGASWKGMRPVQGDKDFVQFTRPEDGIRAIAVILQNYQTKYSLSTVSMIISRWAPPEDRNDTHSYILAVAKEIGVAPDTKINLDDKGLLEKLVAAIIRHENGRVIYSGDIVEEGVSLA